MPEFMENMFETIGRVVGRRPYLTIGLSLLATLILISGYPRLENEGRAEKQVRKKFFPPSKTEDIYIYKSLTYIIRSTLYHTLHIISYYCNM